MVAEPRCIAAVSLAHRVAEEMGCPPPGAAGSSVGYMVHNDRSVHLPSCQVIYMAIGILLKILVSDQGGVAAADNNVDDGGSLYGNDDGNDNNDKE